METTLTTTNSRAAEAPGTNADKKTTLNSDYETFLRMLTVQMKNQDPLNPVDSAEFSLQLATFSALEQQVLTNDLLKELAAGFGANSLQGLSEIVGSEVLAKGGANFDGNPVLVQTDVHPEADAARMVVLDQNGDIVATQEIAIGDAVVEWAGRLENGLDAPTGNYGFRIESSKAGAQLDTRIAWTYAKVTEARFQDQNVKLVLETGNEVLTTDVKGLR